MGVNDMVKKTAITILSLQVLMLLLYFTSVLVLINPPNYILFPVWFLIGIAGIAEAIFMFAKKEMIPLAMIILLLSFAIIAIGGLMHLFLTM